MANELLKFIKGEIDAMARDGTVSTEYVRISDIYSKLKQQESTSIADLPDRLHSLEVGLKYLTSDVLDSDDQEAQHLKSIKNKYSPLRLWNKTTRITSLVDYFWRYKWA